MICHDRRIVFVHIPKAAGTSVEVALGHHGPQGEVEWGAQDHRSVRQLTWSHHLPVPALGSPENTAEVLRAVKARVARSTPTSHHTRVTREQYRSYLSFAVVRNPWARAWSWYRNVVSDPGHRSRLGVSADQPFYAFLRSQLGRDCLRPQTYWLHDFRHRIGVDVVCRFEDLDRDWEQLCAAAGLGAVPLPRVNTGAGPHHAGYTAHYDARSRQVVAECFREEIALFGYRFDDAAAVR